MEKNGLKVITEDQISKNYLTEAHKDGSFTSVKVTWNEVRLLTDEIQMLADGEEVGIRTGNGSATFGHIEARAISKDGVKLFEFVPDFTLQDGEDYFHPIIIFQSGKYFKNGEGVFLNKKEILTMMKDGELTRKQYDGTVIHVTFDEDSDSNGECRLKCTEVTSDL